MNIVGIDVDAGRVEHARELIELAELEDQIAVRSESATCHHGGPYDAVYFSSSFMNMANQIAVLNHVKDVLIANGGLVYFTHSLYVSRVPLLERIKPLLWMFTTIDFGRVIYYSDFRETLKKAEFELIEIKEMKCLRKRNICLIVARPTFH